MMPSDAGRKAYCATCGNEVMCPFDTSESTTAEKRCEDCGLVCPADVEKCPACGGRVGAYTPEVRQAESKPAAAGDAYLKNWESNLGGHSFSVMISLTSVVLCSAHFIYDCLATVDVPMWSFLWWPIAFEVVVNGSMSLLALVLMGMFFSRSRSFVRWLAPYFKTWGWLLLVDFICALIAAAIEYGGEAATMLDVREFSQAFGCFFWAWYFKRIFKQGQPQNKRRL